MATYLVSWMRGDGSRPRDRGVLGRFEADSAKEAMQKASPLAASNCRLVAVKVGV